MTRPKRRLLVFNEPMAMRINTDLATEIGLNESIVLLQMEHLIAISQHEQDGCLWTYQTAEQLQAQFPWWAERSVRRIVGDLVAKHYLKIGHYNVNAWDHTNWYALDPEGISRLSSIRITEPVQIPGSDLDNLSGSIWTTCPDPLGQKVRINIRPKDPDRSGQIGQIFKGTKTTRTKTTTENTSTSVGAIAPPAPETSESKPAKTPKTDDLSVALGLIRQVVNPIPYEALVIRQTIQPLIAAGSTGEQIGRCYQAIWQGRGAREPVHSEQVTIHIRGWLDAGQPETYAPEELTRRRNGRTGANQQLPTDAEWAADAARINAKPSKLGLPRLSGSGVGSAGS